MTFFELTVCAIVFAVLLADGAYQIVSGRPSLLRLDRLIFRRTPASSMDCVIQGASRAFMVLGLAWMLGPLALVLTVDTLYIPGAPPPLASQPHFLFALLVAAWAAAFACAVVCLGIGIVLAARVKYAPVAAPAVSS